jgi:hypothetical protein
LQHVAHLASECRALLCHLDNLPVLHLARARIDEATLSTASSIALNLIFFPVYLTSLIY